MSEALAIIEAAHGSARTCQLLDQAFLAPCAHVIGLTGPPGVGKSTLINALIKIWRDQDLSVGVIAVDPSSRISGGALLGDRTRMITDPDDGHLFIRSLAARGQLGGLSELAFPALTLMRAVYDRVIVETVGVGQSEADISSVTDTVILCVQPGSGDSLQFMKAGIMEIPDIAVVTKSDMGAAAQRALGDLEGGLSLAVKPEDGWSIRVLSLSSQSGEGVEALSQNVKDHYGWLGEKSLLKGRRMDQALNWLRSTLLAHYGSYGLKAAEPLIVLDNDHGPFGLEQKIAERLTVTLTAT